MIVWPLYSSGPRQTSLRQIEVIDQYLSPPPQSSVTVDLGPYDASLPGPLRLRLGLRPSAVGGPLGWGAEIASADFDTGYNYIGLEERVASSPIEWGSATALVEQLCGRCSQANTLAFVQAVEAMAGILVPTRAAYLRLVLVEMERITSHLLNTAETLRVLRMPEEESSLRDIRERVFHALAEWTGSRIQPGLIAFGGLSRHVDEPTSKELALAARPLERALRGHVASIINNGELAARLAGLGVIKPEQAMLAGLRGPNARASGLTHDIRAAVPTGAYEEEGVTIVAQRGGNVFARLVVRLLESLESFRIVEQALDDLPGGPVKGRVSLDVKSGSGIGRVEGPRGEVFCWISGGPEGLTGLHLSTGSFPSLGFLPSLLRGRQFDDLALLILSLDICMGCLER